jgi:hypothetical protein
MNIPTVLALIVTAIVIVGIVLSIIKSYLINGIFVTGGALIITILIAIIFNFICFQKSVN